MNHRRILQIPSPRYFLYLDYNTAEFGVINFEDALYSFGSNEWVYFADTNLRFTESRLSELITEDEERRVALDYEREEFLKSKFYKKIGIY